MSATTEKYARFVDPTFVKLLGVLGYGRVYTRAEGVYVWDEKGRRYLDFLAGFGSVNLGHNHPRLVARMHAFLDELPMNLSHVGPSPAAAVLAEEIARTCGPPLEISLFANSGAEAVEAAMKLARAATRRSRIVFCQGAFHGLSFGTLSVSASERMRRPFSPLLEDCHAIPFGDADALERALRRRDAAAFLVEPIQIEGGLVFPPAGYLAAARDLCSRFGTLFVLDEVQTGFGRTGSMFAYQAESTVPDVLVLAKAAGGGLAPIGITVTTREIRHRAYGSMSRFDLHGSTFAGNAFACVAAAETLRILQDEALPENSRERGAELLERLRSSLAGCGLVKDVRGRGLLVGIELGGTPLSDALSRNVLGQWLAVALLERGVLCQPASQSWNVLRLEPPLTVSSAQIAEAADAVVATLHENRSLTPLLVRAGRRVASQWASGGAFR